VTPRASKSAARSPASKPARRAAGAGLPIRDEVSAGGVAFRREAQIEVVLVSVGEPPRWQLPKGLIDRGETPEQAAMREVREEAGIEAEIVEPLEVIEYWYVDRWSEQRARVHKRVHFYLLEFRGGNVDRHDHEVHEARWFEIGEAARRLAFAAERTLVDKARVRIAAE
jgi:8-oxo-dGTP pyrophosphatase MutT (NUDIX family)